MNSQDMEFLDRLLKGGKPQDSDFIPLEDDGVVLKHELNNVLKESIIVKDSKPTKHE